MIRWIAIFSLAWIAYAQAQQPAFPPLTAAERTLVNSAVTALGEHVGGMVATMAVSINSGRPLTLRDARVVIDALQANGTSPGLVARINAALVAIPIPPKRSEVDTLEAARFSALYGPQFFYVWDQEKVATAKQAMHNAFSVPFEETLAANKEAQNRKEAILDKLDHAPAVIWSNGGWRRQIQFSTPEQIMVGMALTRFHCRQTHDLVDQEIEYWGEIENDDSEDVLRVDPSLCDYYNRRSEALFSEVSHPSMRTWGGNDPTTAQPTWYILQWWTDVAVTGDWMWSRH